MLNDDPGSSTWYHYCYDPATKGPCCTSVEDCREKMVVRLINLFISRAFPIVTMTRFTYVLQGLTRVIAGQACKRILSRSFGSGFEGGPISSKGHHELAEHGAGEDDFERINKSRTSTLGTWLNDIETEWKTPIIFPCC